MADNDTDSETTARATADTDKPPRASKATRRTATEPAGERRAPAEWARETGNVVEIPLEMSVGGKGGLVHRFPGMYHAAAAALHGWREHEHHEGAPMQLSRADYLAAVDAAKAPPKGERSYRPHGPALSPHAPYAKRKG